MIYSQQQPVLALTYDDVNLIPKYSEVQSRSLVSLTSKLTRNYYLKSPYIASPMETICGLKMASTMMGLGGTGCIHRFMSIEEQCNIVKTLSINRQSYVDNVISLDYIIPVVAAIGTTGGAIERGIELIKAGVDVLLIDVAHGDHINVKKTIEALKSHRKNTYSECQIDIIAGSVATGDSTRNLCEWGADAVRVGIGNGSLCSTRIQTGHGVPSLTSILECSEIAYDYDVPVIADGGIRSSGDIAKAIAFGASSVMLGSMLAGTKESPVPYIEGRDGSLWKRYAGSASSQTKENNGLPQKNIEGESTLVRDKGGTKHIIRKLNEGLQSALSYSGTDRMKVFKDTVEYYQVTTAGVAEAKPHLIDK